MPTALPTFLPIFTPIVILVLIIIPPIYLPLPAFSPVDPTSLFYLHSPLSIVVDQSFIPYRNNTPKKNLLPLL